MRQMGVTASLLSSREPGFDVKRAATSVHFSAVKFFLKDGQVIYTLYFLSFKLFPSWIHAQATHSQSP
jgi:hypothetical protein